MLNILGQKGLVNSLLVALFNIEPISFLGTPAYFRPLVFITDAWKGADGVQLFIWQLYQE